MRGPLWPEYLSGVISRHLAHHYPPEARARWDAAPLRFGPWKELQSATDPALLIPTDLESASAPKSWEVPFDGTSLRLWQRVPRPDGWRPWPSDDAPLWYLAGGPRAMPAWDLFGNLLGLLSLAEEAAHPARDPHGRFPREASPRAAGDLIETPAVNDAAAAAVALLSAWREGRTDPDPGGRIRPLPPAVVLSHDLDLLRGNDRITQWIRLWRTLRPLSRGRPPATRFLRAIAANHRHPERAYLGALARICELERSIGARSICYFLNGRGGRFGARSGPAAIPRAAALLPREFALGMHYNYDTLHDAPRFEAQKRELETLLGRSVDGGRAHYLRFAGRGSFAFWQDRGMRWDESLGYARGLGYRAGIAGAYHPPDDDGRPMRLLALPLTFMDAAVPELSPSARRAAVQRLLRHLAVVGGTLTMLFHLEEVGHPDLDGDERPFAQMLEDLRQHGVRFRVPADYLDNGEGGGSRT